jgi:hypothetical protein
MWHLRTAMMLLRNSQERHMNGYVLGGVRDCLLLLGKWNELCIPYI